MNLFEPGQFYSRFGVPKLIFLFTPNVLSVLPSLKTLGASTRLKFVAFEFYVLSLFLAKCLRPGSFYFS